MAICFARLEFVKRSAGKNMLAKSAYTGKLKLEFEGTSNTPSSTYDRTHEKEKPLHHAILLPKNADSQFLDPQKLWNAVERCERRKDAQVGYELLLALPDDKMISNRQRIEMSELFAKKYFVSKGFGVQIDLHCPNSSNRYEEPDEMDVYAKNYHAHILITSRPFNESGDGFSLKKTNDIIPQVRGSSHFAFCGLEWEKLWTQFQNEYFEGNGLDLRVDHKGTVAQIHLGPVRMRSEKAYEILERQDKRIELGQLLMKDPDVILEKITENKSVFSDADLEVFLHKHLLEGDIENVRNTFWKNPNLIQLFDKVSGQPTQKFSSSKVIEEEQQILRISNRMEKRMALPVAGESCSIALTGEQREAYNAIVKGGKSLSCIEGLAGTGKSYLLVALRDHYEGSGYKVRAFGPDNATVKVLLEKGFKDVRNVHQFLFKNNFSKKSTISPGKEIWIVDESGKLGNRPLLELLKVAEKNEIQIIFSGNSAQLSSVERGGFFKIFCERYGHSFLGDIQRQKESSHREIAKRLAHGDVAVAVDMIARTGGFVWSADKEEKLFKAVEKWAADTVDFPYASKLIIAHTNNEVRQINDLIHAVRQSKGEVAEKEFSCQTTFGNIRISEGDVLEFRANSKKLNVSNGLQGVLVSASEDNFVVATEDKKKISFNPKKFTDFQLGYAATYYRSQGRTIDRCYVVYNRHMHQKLLYVGMTRHVRNAHCFVSKTDASCLMDIKRQAMRKSEQENTLNYTYHSEIKEAQKTQKREKEIQDFCSSEELLSRAKGYSLKTWDTLKAHVSSFVEKVQDRHLDANFYVVPSQSTKGEGRVVEVKEELLESLHISDKTQQKQSAKESSSLVEVKKGALAPSQNPEKAQQSKSNCLQKLHEDKRKIYTVYFEKTETASSLYAIIQAEVTASSISKEAAPSFVAWQKACGERNAAAFDLLRGGVQHKTILGQKGFEILQERAMRYEQVIQPKDSLATQLTDKIEGLLYQLFPDGPQRKDKRSFRFGSNGSLAVTCVGEKKGCYYDFANKEGGNLLQLIQKKENLSISQACSWARDFLKESAGKPTPSHYSIASFSKMKEDTWISLEPSSDKPLPALNFLSRHLDDSYCVAAHYPYYNEQNKLICYTLRLEPKAGGKKIVLPASYGKTHPETEAKWGLRRYKAQNALIYNLPLVQQSPSKPILIVEGEKTANAAHEMLGNEYTVISWLGGAAAANSVDWKKLFGRDIVIWPDNDPAGFKAAADICGCLRQTGVKSLKQVSNDALKDFPLKWDLADTLPADKSANFVRDILLRADSKAIGIDRLEAVAAQHGMTFNQLNEIVVDVDKRLRSDLEQRHGSKVWEIDSAILKEVSQLAQAQGKNGLQAEVAQMPGRQSILQEQCIPDRETARAKANERER